jgi:hypothetical protein
LISSLFKKPSLSASAALKNSETSYSVAFGGITFTGGVVGVSAGGEGVSG